MEIFFADDSAQRTCRRGGMGPVFGVGGVLIEESAIQPLGKTLDDNAIRFGIPKGEELKWSPAKKSWIRENLQAERTNCYQQALEAAANHRAKVIVVCNDTGRTGHDPDQAFQTCLTYLIERLNMNLKNRDSRALIVADRPGGGKTQEDKFLSYFLRTVQEGTEYVLPSRLMLNVLTTPSDMVRHLQLADIVTGVVTAVVAGNDAYAGALFPYIRPLFITNRPGGIAGTGLKIIPDSTRGDSLVNLYHWVLSERLLHKSGGAQAYQLPAPGFPFAKDALTA
jgi:hypothetical protein